MLTSNAELGTAMDVGIVPAPSHRTLLRSMRSLAALGMTDRLQELPSTSP